MKGATFILRISWDEAWHIMEQAVSRGLKRKKKRIPKTIGVDEKSVGKGHDYITLANDVDRATVDYIGDDRKQESLDGYFGCSSEKKREKIKAIAVDIWDPYLASIRNYLPEVEEKIIFDRYHFMTHIIKAVDEVRKEEHRELKRAEDERLAGSKYLWLYWRENVPDKHKSRLRSLSRQNLKTARAWAIKESFRELWGFRHSAWALRHFTAWYFWATHSRLEPLIEKARMFVPDSDVLQASDHQCGERRTQFQDPDDQEDGLRLPEPRELRDRELFPLRGLISLSCYP